MKSMGCNLSNGDHCPFIDAAFKELSVGLAVPGCPWIYSPRTIVEEKCSLYRAVQDAADEFTEDAHDA